MSDESYVFKPGDRVEFENFEGRFRGKILGLLTGQLGNLYYVVSGKGEVRIYIGKALTRRD